MGTTARTIFLLARLLLMSEAGTDLIAEHRASVPVGGTGLVVETLDLEGLPGALHIYLTPAEPESGGQAAGAGAAGEASSEGKDIEVGMEVRLWESAADARSGRPPLETNREVVVLSGTGSTLVQLAESPGGERRLFVSLAAPPEPGEPAPWPSAIAREPQAIGFRVELFRGTPSARELIERRLLLTVERSPVSWEARWKRPIPLDAGGGISFRDEGVTLHLRPVIARAGWISVEATLSALLYREGEQAALTPSTSLTRTLPFGIPLEISLALPPEEEPSEGGDDGEEAEGPSFIAVVTPYRPGG